MKSLRTGSALVIAAVVAAGAFAQGSNLSQQFDELKASVQRLEAESAALKAQWAPGNAGLECEINRLAERVAAGTNLRSCASAIKMGGEFRYRRAFGHGEHFANLSDGGGTGPFPGPEPVEHDGFWGDMRTRLNFQYDFGCDVTAFAELQAHDAMGEDQDGPIDELDGNDSDGDVQMYQTWLEFRNIFCRPELSARIGRQEVVLGNQFQFGNADWYNGVVHDGLRVDYKSNCWSLTLLALKLDSEDGDSNQIWSYFNDHDDDELYSAYFTLKSMKCMVLDLYWIYINGHGTFALNSGANVGPGFLYPTSSAYYHTFGARLGGTMNVACGLDYNVEAAVQTGSAGALDVGGWSGEAELGVTFSKSSKFRVFARGLFAEGLDGEDEGYLINYPNRHGNGGFRARYGIADLIPMTNVVSLQAGFHFDPACDWTLGATGLWAETEEDFGTGFSAEYGTELDLWAEWRYSKEVTVNGGIAFVFPDDSGQLAWGVTDDTQVIAYLQTRLVF